MVYLVGCNMCGWANRSFSPISCNCTFLLLRQGRSVLLYLYLCCAATVPSPPVLSSKRAERAAIDRHENYISNNQINIGVRSSLGRDRQSKSVIVGLCCCHCAASGSFILKFRKNGTIDKYENCMVLRTIAITNYQLQGARSVQFMLVM